MRMLKEQQSLAEQQFMKQRAAEGEKQLAVEHAAAAEVGAFVRPASRGVRVLLASRVTPWLMLTLALTLT